MLKIRLTPMVALCFASLGALTSCGDDGDPDTMPIDEPDSGSGSSSSTAGTSNQGSGNSTGATTTGATSREETRDPTSSSDTDGGGAEVPDTDGGTGAGDDGGTENLPTIAELVAGSEDFTVLASALATTGLDEALDGDGPFTVFAPTDEAFALLPEGLLTSLTTEQLSSILQYHVVSGAVQAETVVTLDSAETLLDESVKIQAGDEGVYLNGLTKVVTTDIATANGIVHVIDSVLVPGAFPGTIKDVLGAYPRLSVLFGAATTEAADALSGDNLTLLAPVDSAFEGVDLTGVDDLNPILFYHVLPTSAPAAAVVDLATARSVGGPFMGIDTSEGVKINDGSKLTNVIYTDIAVDSGEAGSIIHLIDEVLVPPPAIAEVAEAAGLTTLVDVLALADVPGTETTFAEALSGEGPFTVFAPSNAAFAAIPEPGFGADLADVLGAHAFGSAVDSKAVLAVIEDTGISPETLTSADNKSLGLSLIDGTVVINGRVQVTTTDIPAANGVIHLVDSVIVPSSIEFPGNIVEALSAYPLFSSLVTAAVNAEDADVATALQGDGPFTLFAPVNAAFEGIDTTDDLSSVLLYHVLAGTAYDSADVVGLTEPTDFETLNGADLVIDGEALTVNDTAILGTDLRTSNGVIHVIEDVLMPPAN
jgi:transforming growth factor-beta-induced protein